MLELLDAKKSALIFVRHGESFYSNEFPDLTDLGVKQLERTAHDLEPIVRHYRHFLVSSSPAVRALGSANVFLKTLGNLDKLVNLEEDLGPIFTKDLPGFINYLGHHGDSQLGAVWLRDELFDSPENNLTEPRKNVNKRAYNFLGRCYSTVERICNGDPACSFYFTHYEIMTNYLIAIYDGQDSFPIETEPGPENGEAVIFQPDRYNPGVFTVIARSRVVQVRFLPKLGRFERLA